MAKNSLLPNSPGEEDSWEDLAGDLFGIDFNETLESVEIISPEELAADQPDRADQNPPTETDQSDAELADAPQPFAETSDDDDDDFAVGVAEPTTAERTISAQESATAETSAVDETSVVDENSAVDETSPASETEFSRREEDTFWDPLDEWQWGSDERQDASQTDAVEFQPAASEEDGGKADAKAEAEAVVSDQSPPTVSPVIDSPATAVLREEYVDDSDFASGLLAEETSTESSTIAEKSDSESREQDGGKTPRRRRRRRRRPRSEKSETSEDVKTDAAAVDDGSSALDEQSSEKPIVKNEPSERRRSRRLAKPEKKPDETTTLADRDEVFIPEGDSDEDSAAPSESSAERKRAPRRESPYRDVPTWVEAVACMLNPQPAPSSATTSDTRETAESKTSHSDSKRSSRSPNRRRRRPSK